MASNHTASSSDFNNPISMIDGSDSVSATQMRAILEKLHDNTAHLRDRTDASQVRLAAALRKKVVVFSDTADAMAAVTLVGAENAPGPLLAIKSGQAAQAVYDHDTTENYAGGSTPALGQMRDAAVNPAGRIVIVGASSPYTAFRVPGGSWTNGGSESAGSLTQVIYDPGYGGFMASRTTNVWRSTDAVSWASVPSGLAGVQRLAAVGAGGGNGRIVALSTATVPVFAISTNHGASFSASGGTVPNAASADGCGTLAGCPQVSRAGLNQRVYHAASYNSGARVRLASSQDGVVWVAGPTIEAPAGRTFSSTPVILVCKTTGFMCLVVETTITADAQAFFTLYTSDNFNRWTGVATSPSTGASTPGFAVAGGRLLMTNGADLWTSDGVSYEVFQ